MRLFSEFKFPASFMDWTENLWKSVLAGLQTRPLPGKMLQRCGDKQTVWWKQPFISQQPHKNTVQAFRMKLGRQTHQRPASVRTDHRAAAALNALRKWSVHEMHSRRMSDVIPSTEVKGRSFWMHATRPMCSQMIWSKSVFPLWIQLFSQYHKYSETNIPPLTYAGSWSFYVIKTSALELSGIIGYSWN